MVAQIEFLDKIKTDFRLNVYEVKIWTSLLSRGIATAGELADISGVPRSRCYDVLESLEKKGFIIMKVGKPIKYIAVNPEEIVGRVKKTITNDADLQLNLMDKLKKTNVFKELELLHKTGIEHVEPSEITNSFVGRDNIYLFLRNMMKGAKKSITIATTREGFHRKAGMLRGILSNNKINVEIIAPVDEKMLRKAKIPSKSVNIKNVENSARFISVDDDQILFMTTDESTNPDYDAAIWIKSEFFNSGFKSLFNNSL